MEEERGAPALLLNRVPSPVRWLVVLEMVCDLLHY